MSQPPLRLFVKTGLSQDAVISLSQEHAHYLNAVMRRDVGAPLLLFNGRDGEWYATISELNKKSAVAKIEKQTRPQHNVPDIHLLFAPVKRGSIDQIAQKATELGVSLLYPVQTERTIVTRVKEDRLHANAIEAAEQCERLTVPEIYPFTKLTKVLDRWTQDQGIRRILFCDEAGDDETERRDGEVGRAVSAHDALLPYKNDPLPWAILTGPEGGFTPKERAHLRNLSFVTTASLGPRILRADTAAFAALTLWQNVLGDF